MGVQIRTIISDNVAKRCEGCQQVIDGTPWRINLLDIVTAETPVSWTARPAINPGPFQFHGDAACVRRWMASRATCSAGAARCARSCAPSRSPVRTRPRMRAAGACAMASIATTTSSSRPDRRGPIRARRKRRRRVRSSFDSTPRAALSSAGPGEYRGTQIYPGFAMSTGRSAVSPHGWVARRHHLIVPRSSCPTSRLPPLERDAGCRSDRPAASSASIPTPSAGGPMRAGSRHGPRPAGIGGSIVARSNDSPRTGGGAAAGRWPAWAPPRSI